MQVVLNQTLNQARCWVAAGGGCVGVSATSSMRIIPKPNLFVTRVGLLQGAAIREPVLTSRVTHIIVGSQPLASDFQVDHCIGCQFLHASVLHGPMGGFYSWRGQDLMSHNLIFQSCSKKSGLQPVCGAKGDNPWLACGSQEREGGSTTFLLLSLCTGFEAAHG